MTSAITTTPTTNPAWPTILIPNYGPDECEIQLTQGKVALVDAEDFERINAFSWFAQYNPGNGHWYSARDAKVDGKMKRIYMHAEIVKPAPGLFADHKDRNCTLDNRRSNLRIATKSQNAANRKLHSNNTTGFKGVVRAGSRFIAQIMANGKQHFLGSFSDKADAARAYDKKAFELFGEFAYLNFPESNALAAAA